MLTPPLVAYETLGRTLLPPTAVHPSLNHPEVRATSFVGKEDVTMPAKYDKDVKAKAIWPVRDHAGDYDTE
jgi:hypothetical protein